MKTTNAADRPERTMAPADGQKMENLRVLRGGRYAQRPARIFTSLEIQLDVDMQRLFGEVTSGGPRRSPTRGFRRAFYGESHPWRVLARYIVGAARGEAKEEQVMAILDRLTEFAREAFRKHGHRRAA